MVYQGLLYGNFVAEVTFKNIKTLSPGTYILALHEKNIKRNN